MSDNKNPLKIVLHGFDVRGAKTLVMYLERYCKRAAQVVAKPEEAEADVFDFDVKASKALLESHLQESLLRPVIVLSLREANWEDVLLIKKPVNANDMMQVLEKAKKIISDFPKPKLKEDKEEKASKKTKLKKQEKTKPDAVDSRKKQTEELSENIKDVKNRQTAGKAPQESIKSKDTSKNELDESENILQTLDDWFDL